MADQTTQQVLTGNIIRLVINNKEIGLAQSADGDRNFQTEGVYGIGSIRPVEHVPLRYDGTLTIDRFFLRNADLRSLGLAPLSADDILTLGIISGIVVDKVSKKTLRQYIGMTCASYSESFRANAISGERATWKYLDCRPMLSDPAGGVLAG